MLPMTVVSSPPPGRGRPPLAGTVLAAPGGARYVVCRCAFSGGENVGGTGGPRVEVWVALASARTPTLPRFHPLVVRGSGRRGSPLEWQAVEHWHEVGEIRRHEVVEAVGLALHEPEFRGDMTPDPRRPSTIWDRRVLLPDDDRFPPGRPRWLVETLTGLLARRNSATEADGAVIDALVMNFAPRAACRRPPEEGE